jgi:DNA-binding NarL/FixJ family response regulator
MPSDVAVYGFQLRRRWGPSQVDEENAYSNLCIFRNGHLIYGRCVIATASKLRILIADDEPLILSVVKQILESEPHLRVVGQALDGPQAVTQAEALRPDVIVLDLNMPTMSGFEVARRIRTRHPNSAIVILSSHKNDQFIAEARAVGARAYVEKSDAADELVRAVESAAKGEEFFLVL